MKLKGGLAMITQKDFLRFAFEEAINEVNPNSIERDVVKPIIKTGMQAYADREGCKFTDEEIAEGICFLAGAIRMRQPSAEVKVVGILPRRDMEERVRELNTKIRALLPAGIVFTDAGESLLNAQGKIDESLFRDGLHPNEKGYERIVKKVRK